MVPEQPRGWGWAAWLQLSVYSSHSIRLDQTTWGGGSYGHCVSNKAQAVCQVLTCTAMSALITHHQSHNCNHGARSLLQTLLYILSQAHQGSFQFILQGKQKRRAGRGFGAKARRQNFHKRRPWCRPEPGGGVHLSKSGQGPFWLWEVQGMKQKCPIPQPSSKRSFNCPPGCS